MPAHADRHPRASAPAESTVGVEAKLRAAVAEKVGAAKFGLWFGEEIRLGVDGDSLQVRVPNGFFREWIQGHFSGSLIEAAEAVVGRPLRLTFQIEAEPEPVPLVQAEAKPPVGRPKKSDRTNGAGDRPATTAPIPKPVSVPIPIDRPRSNQSRPSRRLDDFIPGPGSRLALAAAHEMAISMGQSFNPLVVHGGTGLGKTHMLEGIATAMRAANPGIRLVHITAESFTNGFLDAMRANSLSGFRARYRGVEALIVDDVHFLAAKRATQIEFQHTFDALAREGLPIVLAADLHPRQIAKLTDELATRFLGGMVVKLEAPDPTTRRAILKHKALARGVDVPETVIAYVAEHLRSSVRELEGALHSLLAHALLTGKRLDLNLAKTALRDTIRHTSQSVALKDIERAICRLFNIDPEVLKSEGRSHSIAHPRMLAMYLCRKHAGAAYSEIGRFFGGRNHSTVISAEKKVIGWLKDEKQHGMLAGFETVGDVLASLERELGA
jgi:chromosomal replication initiator protein